MEVFEPLRSAGFSLAGVFRRHVFGGSCELSLAARARIRKAPIYSLFLVFLLASVGARAQNDSGVKVGAPAGWVNFDLEVRPHSGELPAADEDVRLILLDRQIHVGTAESFVRIGRQILNDAGVQNGSQISVSFDPMYQEVIFHRVLLRRETGELDRLDRSKIRVIQQEQELNRHIYNGRLSAVLFLEDVRMGDLIEYAYTVRGVNPAFKGRFVESFYLQFAVPLDALRLRVLAPADRKLTLKDHGGDFPPEIRQRGPLTEYTWTRTAVSALLMEDGVPISFDPYPWVQFSEFGSWKELAQWALELYPEPGSLAPELEARIAEWQQRLQNPQDRARAALQFVQDEIRYLGMEMGIGSYRPSDPSTVFARRFGDCKDKTYLLGSILDRLGVDAAPVLVNSSARETIQDWLPSPHAFDHVVTQIRIDGRTYWVDATASSQRGPLAERSFPHYGRGLVVRPDTAGLVWIDNDSRGSPKRIIEETFHVRGKDEPADFKAETETRGEDAENLRSAFAQNRREDIEKGYLNYYAYVYPKSSIGAPLEMSDDPDKNVVRTVERYRIEDFWEWDSERKLFTCEFFPRQLHALVTAPSTTLRSMPLGIPHPRHMLFRTVVHLPEEWPIKEISETISAPTLFFSLQRRAQGTNLIFDFEYRTLTNAVAAADVPAHLKNLKRIRELIGYNLSWGDETEVAASKQMNWPILSAGSFYLVLLVIGSAVVYRMRPDPALPPPIALADEAVRLRGIGGWLILVAMGVIASPIRLSVGLSESLQAYSAESWNLLTVPGSEAYHSLWAPYLIFALLANLTLMVCSVLNVVLFFQKRRVFRAAFMAFLAFNAVVLTADYIVAKSIPAAAAEMADSDLKDVSRAYVGCFIWIPYMLVSRRARLTFVE